MKSDKAYIPLILRSRILKENWKYLFLIVGLNLSAWIFFGIKANSVDLMIRDPLMYFHLPGIIYVVWGAKLITERFMNVFNIDLYNSAINTKPSKEFKKIEKILGEKSTDIQKEILNLICNKNEIKFIAFFVFFLIAITIFHDFILTKNFGTLYYVHVYPWTYIAHLVNAHIYWTLFIVPLLFSLFWILIGMLRVFKLMGHYTDLMLASGDEDEKLCLFTWDKVPGIDSHKLLKYLQDDYNVGWVHKPKIRKSNEDKAIYISKSTYSSSHSRRYKIWGYILEFSRFFQKSFNDENSAEIVLDKMEEKVTLKISDSRIYNLNVKKKNGKLDVYEKVSYNGISLKNFKFNIKPIIDLIYLTSSLTIIFSFLYSVAVVLSNSHYLFFLTLLVILGGLSIFLWPQITLHNVLENVRESTLLEYYNQYENKRLKYLNILKEPDVDFETKEDVRKDFSLIKDTITQIEDFNTWPYFSRMYKLIGVSLGSIIIILVQILLNKFM